MAMEAGEDVFLVPAIGSLAQTILESLDKMDAWIRQVGLGDGIKGLVWEIERVNAVVSGVTGRTIRSTLLAKSLVSLKEKLYDADNVVDELDYNRLLQQVEGVTVHEPECRHGTAQVDSTFMSDDDTLPPTGRGKKRSKVWDNYVEVIHKGERKAKCIHCKDRVQYNSKQGTRVLINHVKSARCNNKKREASRHPSNNSSIDDALEDFTPVAGNDLSSRESMRTHQDLTHITAAGAHPWNKDDISSRIQEITSQLQDIREDGIKDLNMLGLDSGASSSRQRTSSLLQGKVYGRDEEKNSIIKLMTDGKSDSVTVLPIVGIGGVGKTFLAQSVCNDPGVENQFDHIIWVQVSNGFEEERVTEEMLNGVLRENHAGSCRLDNLQRVLKSHIKSKRVLLILDDVWDDMKEYRWKLLLAPFKSNNVNGNVILVTTRNLSVAKRIGTAEPVVLRALGDANYWLLFKVHAFGDEKYEGHQNLTKIGRKIADKLKGNPLAAVTAGELLRSDLTIEHWITMLKDEDGKLLGGIMAALKLSYDKLPYHLHRCFSYCSIFPDTNEFVGEELVRIWISQGFVKQSHPSKRLEEIGMDYLADLLNLGYFQHVGEQNSSRGSQKCYDMCGTMRDFARMISTTECATIDGLRCHDILPSVKHLSIVYSKDQHGNIPNKFEENLRNTVTSVVTKLRTLVLVGQYDTSFFLSFQDIFRKARKIRVLQVSATLADFNSLICTLVTPTHLRYLKLAVNGADGDLPQVLSKFCHLQVLDVGSNTNVNVPNDMNHLVSLRHLVAKEGAYSSLARIGKLTSLQELQDFSVQNSDGFGIVELQLMNDLVQLGISQLEKVKTRQEAYGAGLRDKRHLEKLYLSWSSSTNTDLEEYLPEEVLEGLQPHNNLKHLRVSRYKGATSPSWLASNISVTYLETLHLVDCPEWRTLPSLKKLRFLTNLKLSGMHNVIKVSVPSLESLVLSKMQKLETCSCSSMKNLNACLKVLKIKMCPALKVFDLFENGIALLETEQKWLPSLCKVIVHDCPHLRLPRPLPSSSNVSEISMIRVSKFPRIEGSSNRELTIQSEELSELDGKFFAFDNLRFLKQLKIVRCGNLTYFSLEGLRQLTALEELTIIHCEELFCSDNLLERTREDVTAANCKALPSLRHLHFRSCGIKWEWLDLVLQHVPALQKLVLAGCKYLKYVPLHSCTALETLWVMDCMSVSALEGLQSQSLKDLTVSRCPELKYLQLHSCTSLERLDAINCVSLIALEGLQSQSLKYLKVSQCDSLKDLPLGLHSLLSLEILFISDCRGISRLPEKGLPPSLKQLNIDRCGEELNDQCRKLKTKKLTVTIKGP